MAKADLISYDLESYPSDLLKQVESLENRSDELDSPVRLNLLKCAIYELDLAAKGFRNVYQRVFTSNKQSSNWFDRINRQLMDLEKSFIHKTGLQDRPWNRSLFTAEDPFSGYGSWMLPGLRCELEHRSTENIQKWELAYVRAIETLGSRIRKITESLSSLG